MQAITTAKKHLVSNLDLPYVRCFYKSEEQDEGTANWRTETAQWLDAHGEPPLGSVYP